MQGKNSKNKKNWPKYHIFGAVRGRNRYKNPKPPKGTAAAYTKSAHQIPTSDSIQKEEAREIQFFFNGKKGENPSYHPS